MNSSVSKYTLRFALVYTAVLIIAGIVMTVLDMDNGNAGIQVVLVMCSGMIVADKFVKDHMRVPDKAEKRGLVYGSFAYSILISCMGAALIYFAASAEEKQALLDMAGQVPPLFYAGIFAFTAIILLMALSFSYGHMAKKILEGYEKRAQKNKAL